MNFFRSSRANSHFPIDDGRPAKRISTPAGQRLSVILDNKLTKSPANTAKINVTTESTFCNDPSHQHVGPVLHVHKNERKKGGVFSALTGGRLNTPNEDRANNGSNLSVSVWSDREDEKFGHVRQRRRGIFAWGRKRLALVVAVLIVLIVALAVGLSVGLKKHSGSSSQDAANGSQAAGSPSGTNNHNQNNGADSPTGTDKPPAPSPAAPQPSVPPNFPVGAYSLVVFLDTVTPECTANQNTWTCAPNTDYYADPQKALTVLNWEIAGSSDSYKISSQGHDDTFDTTFQNENLELLDVGQETERYRFQISRSKSVNMTGTLGDSKGDFECDYSATNIQAFLYTKMLRTYPDDTIAVQNTPNVQWPFAVRIEQAVAGGEGVPSCKDSSGDSVGLKAQDAGTLCSCLYKNWTPQK
ncbi:hypothetical protein COCC4DRAFT_198424 [Bipolaris maydis ATCC 48331]|uniref:Tat pathway signal sequence n=2 Tax=Cochliobolus heterostrophus TaxID=5016 RepID=M2UGN5_COCH5|nr:uncharacterized protein COCC4DRAFT_198424 [Bipolaris maydis ATCC 48331]EMD87122.1 hypothetical protein COCHEDRAFT_1146233 [Bipolaris maydis C5]KAH7559679.1 hypothetical protein BM1_03313 [Bipolaris maydis]ENI03885.1 hypothetical protein COCC4DRAFT_198424 [Bipolaris maydis ATCC 48331]KAJ5021565.1 hypothetical protein J3E73DRAFT_434697 [Bipolaris maydis]KAJ5055795.1 hypothetical protein J3E74DRAFT_422301 [Bipolaris maydis]